MKCMACVFEGLGRKGLACPSAGRLFPDVSLSVLVQNVFRPAAVAEAANAVHRCKPIQRQITLEDTFEPRWCLFPAHALDSPNGCWDHSFPEK